MAAATQDIVSDKLGTEEIPDPALLSLPVEANTQIFAGTMVATNASGNAVPASSATAKIVWGRAERGVNNLTTNSPFGAAQAQQVLVRKGPFYQNQDGTISQANVGQNCFAADDNTVSLSDLGGTRPFAGVIMPMQKGSAAALATSSQVAVWLGAPNAYALNPQVLTTVTEFKARNVVTSLAAYTGSGTNTLTASANGAWAAQDGVTNAAGDVVFIFATTSNLTSAVDSGPWVISSLGGASAKFVLVRPDWFVTGAAVIQGLDIVIGGEGTAWAGNTFRSFAGTGQIIGTNDPVFYPKFQSVTTAAMTAGVSAANSTLFVRALAQFSPIPVTPGGTQGILRMSTSTAGYPGTSSLVVTSSSGTDTSTVKIQVVNF